MQPLWVIWFTDGTIASSEDATPFGLTRRADVQVITQNSPDHNWVTLSGYDYYVWDARGGVVKWWGVDLFGLHHYLLQPGSKCVLFGTMIDKKTFREIYDRAVKGYGDKTIFTRDERKP